MPKFLIYSGDNVSAACATDLKVFFEKTFESVGCDVVAWHPQQNLDGLNQLDAPTFVVPGGCMWSIYRQLEAEFDKIATYVNHQGFHYIGSCAGAYITGDTITVAATTIEENALGEYRQIPRPAPYRLTTRPGMGLLPGVSTFGPLYSHPFQSYDTKPIKNGKGVVFPFMPYSFTLKPLAADSFTTTYLSGCGFTVAPGSASSIETLAVYQDLLIHGRAAEYTANTPAILYKMGQEAHEGNVLVSSAHLETCAPNSCLLSAIRTLDSTQYDSGRLSMLETLKLEDAANQVAQTQFFGDAIKRLYLDR